MENWMSRAREDVRRKDNGVYNNLLYAAIWSAPSLGLHRMQMCWRMSFEWLPNGICYNMENLCPVNNWYLGCVISNRHILRRGVWPSWITISLSVWSLLIAFWFVGRRPFGVSLLYAGWDKHYGFQLYQSDPSGNYGGWKATCIGNNSNVRFI